MRNIGANHESIAECFIAITGLKGGILCRLSSRQAVTSLSTGRNDRESERKGAREGTDRDTG